MSKSKLNDFAFMCCSRKDKKKLKVIADSLKKEGCCFVSSDNIFESGIYCENMQKAIEECAIFIVFFTANSCEDNQIKEQVQTAYNLNKKIYPIVYPGVTMTDSLRYMTSNINQIPGEELKKRRELRKIISEFLINNCVEKNKQRKLSKKLKEKRKVFSYSTRLASIAIAKFTVLIVVILFLGINIIECYRETEIVYGQYQFIGVLQENGTSYYLELNEPILYRMDFESEPMTGSVIYIEGKDAGHLHDYVGMTLTLEGRLFEYRIKDTLMFEEEPTIIKVHKTVKNKRKSGLYRNWNKDDSEERYKNALDLFIIIIHRCEFVHNVYLYSGSQTTVSVEENKLEECYYVHQGMYGNRLPIESNGYYMYIAAYEDHIRIIFENRKDESYVFWDYDWAGRLIGDNCEPLEEFLISAGLV